VAEAALERLKTEFRDERIVFALGGFNELRTNESAEVDGLGHGWFFGLVLPESIRHRPASPFMRGKLERG
jgi:hypothetical protein